CTLFSIAVSKLRRGNMCSIIQQALIRDDALSKVPQSFLWDVAQSIVRLLVRSVRATLHFYRESR
ncbi:MULTISPECIES: hypothetical protein, partial [unclassified Microcoleus]|uniref:hypothetical protein n=1 Tax=unclassified Microcoleus TaxID=2642155 RepID=UPI002FD05D94